MLHEAVINLANQLGIKLADRNASESWMYDGHSIALWKYTASGPDYWVDFTEHDILHELGHYVAAAPEQRDLPEFGLEWGAVVSDALGPRDGTYRSPDGSVLFKCSSYKGRWNVMSLVLDKEEEEIQEFMAQQFCILVGARLGLSPLLAGEEHDCFNSWESYRLFLEKANSDSAELVAQAKRRVANLLKELNII